jgi:large subunit ribosomal protein L21
MYSIVEVGGHQYKVKAGDVIDVQKLEVEAGSDLNIDQVLFVGGEQTLIGKPTVEGAKVVAKVIRHDRSRKIIVFKRKPGMYRKKNGHRQPYTSLLITEVSANGKSDKIANDNKWAQKYLK